MIEAVLEKIFEVEIDENYFNRAEKLIFIYLLKCQLDNRGNQTTMVRVDSVVVFLLTFEVRRLLGDQSSSGLYI